MHRTVPAREAEGLLPEENPPVLLLHGRPLQLPEHMGSRPLWCCKSTVTHTRLRRAAVSTKQATRVTARLRHRHVQSGLRHNIARAFPPDLEYVPSDRWYPWTSRTT